MYASSATLPQISMGHPHIITSLCAKRSFLTSDSHLPTFLHNSQVQVVAFAAVLLLFASWFWKDTQYSSHNLIVGEMVWNCVINDARFSSSIIGSLSVKWATPILRYSFEFPPLRTWITSPFHMMSLFRQVRELGGALESTLHLNPSFYLSGKRPRKSNLLA